MADQPSEKWSQAREDWIVETFYRHAGSPRIELDFVPLRYTRRNHDITVLVAADALKIDGIRVGMTPVTHQRIADLIGGAPLTELLADIAWQQFRQLQPVTLWRGDATGKDLGMADFSRTIEHNIKVDAQIVGEPPSWGYADVGKDWITHTKLRQYPDRGANYGWHIPGRTRPGKTKDGPFRGPSGAIQWQTTGLRHNLKHSDYSQTGRWVLGPARVVTPDGDVVSVPLGDLYASGLASYDHDPAPPVRHPGVPEPGPAAPTLPGGWKPAKSSGPSSSANHTARLAIVQWTPQLAGMGLAIAHGLERGWGPRALVPIFLGSAMTASLHFALALRPRELAAPPTPARRTA
jgi:hypothetical protein